jgi:hypothetical protein
MRKLILASFCACLAAPVAAREYYYFNKPAVTRDQYVADKAECDALAGGVKANSQTIYVPSNPNLTAGQNALAVGLASLFAGMIGGDPRKRSMQTVERTCMADKGYGRYIVEKSVVAEISKLKDEAQQLERYFSLASTTQPIGQRTKE